MQPDSQPPAPAVVAVVVTCDSGPWLEQALSSLAAQDYPNVSVVVVDSASAVDPTPLVDSVLPGAFVWRLEKRVGFGRAANQVRQLVEGASHYLFCHDDVILAPDAVRLLLEEAFRSNSAITSPKYLEWEDPERLLAVGATADKVGVLQDLVDPGELDQAQHDGVREVLVAPAGVSLVRADLFEALGGFDETIDQFGEDLDLCWRARVVGGRITVVPAARVMHLQAVKRGVRAGWGTLQGRRRAAAAAEGNRLRTLLTCYRWFDVAWIFPLSVAWILGEAATRLVQGRPGEAGRTLSSFFGGLREPGRLWKARHALQRHRRVGDAAIRKLQSRGNARLRGFIRARIEGVREGLPPAPVVKRVQPTGYEEPTEVPVYATPETDPETTPVSADRRLAMLILLVVAIVLLVGSRSLLGREIPAVGHIPNTSTGIGPMWSQWWSTWQTAGLGAATPSAPAVGLLALLGTVLFGAVGVLQHVVVLGPLVLGPLGAYRAARWWGSRRGKVAAAVVYAVCPLPYNALARGHWGALLAFGAAPWVIGWLGRLSGQVPFPVTPVSRIYARAAALAVLVAVVGAVAPSWLFVVPLVALGLLAGSALAGMPGGGLRMFLLGLATAFGAVVLLLPWSGTVLGSRVSTAGPSLGAGGRLGFGAVLRFQTGPFGHGVLGWALLVVAALPLFIGRGWRLAWAARLWSVAVLCFAAAWAGSRGWVPALPPDVVLAPAAAALAGSAALGAAAFELDLPGYRFGWRQLAAGIAAVAVALAAVPLLAATKTGRWQVPSADPASELPFLPDTAHGDYRVLWVGSPDALPLAGYQLSTGVAYGTSYDGPPNLGDLWVTGRRGAAGQLASDVRLVEGRLTTKLGHLLAPAGVLFVVVPNHTAPAGAGGFATPPPASLLQGLSLQTDMQVVDQVDSNYTVYRNAAWMPVKAALPESALAVARAGAAGRVELQQLDLSGAVPVLTGPGNVTSGRVAAGSTVYVASTRDGGWNLQVGSSSLSPRPGFGWGMRFKVPGGGGSPGGGSAGGGGAGTAASGGAPRLVRATLHAPSPLGIRAAQVVEIALWLLALGFVTLDIRKRRNEDVDPEVVRPEWFVPVSPAADRRNWRSGPSSSSLGAEDMKGDEVWADV
ncbi:MAG TPA: glycosyltransferase [Acidimicrobiales bacterium]